MTEWKYLGTYLPARPLDWVSVSCSWCSAPLSLSLQEDVCSAWSSTPGQLTERAVDHETLFKGRASCLWSPAAMSVPLGQNSCLPPGTIRSQAEGGMRSTSKSALKKFRRTHTHNRERKSLHKQLVLLIEWANAIPACCISISAWDAIKTFKILM